MTRDQTPLAPLDHRARLHSVVLRVIDSLTAVEIALRLNGSPAETGKAMVALGPRIGELGRALKDWDRWLEQQMKG